MKILVGAGPDAPSWSANGWVCNDLESAASIYSGITIVGPCWALPVEDNSVDEIMARGMMEHLTYHEVARSFAEWKRVLKPGGFFTTEAPDIDMYLRMYLDMRQNPEKRGGEGGDAGAEGEPQDFEACTGIDRWLRRALYGWQHWPGDEHRSGWTEQLLKHYIEKHFGGRQDVRHMAYSYEDDTPDARVRHLWARAWKE